MSPTPPVACGRRIALLRPAVANDERVAHAMQLLDSILWAFQGTTHSNWTIGATEIADVFVVHEQDTDERIASWREQGKPVVQIVTNRQPVTVAPDVLVYPFRPAQVLSLLEKLDARLTSGVEPDSATAPAEEKDPWSFVEALRTLRSVQNSEAWLAGRDGRTPVLWLRGDAATYLADAGTVQALRKGSLRLSQLTLRKGTQPADGPQPRSGMELSWFAGYHASGEPHPGLRADTRYRITRWPNFGLIRPLPSQLRVASNLAAAAADLNEISTRAGVSVEEVARTLNALHTCGVLLAVPREENTAAPGKSPVPEPRAGFARFLSSIRKHLGLGVDRS
jgi:hypothetical protein